MAPQVRGDRICQSSDCLFTRFRVLEDHELGIEDLVGLANWNLEGHPVTGRGNRRRRNAVFAKPGVYRLHRIF